MDGKIEDPEGDQRKEYDKFEKEAGEDISSNAAKIEKLKEESPKHEDEGRNENFFFYYRNLIALEQKNNDLKNQLKESKFDSNWRRFRDGFKSYMDDLMVAFKNFVPKR